MIDTKRLEAYLGVDPTNLALLGELADAFIDSGRAAMALPYVERALQQSPGNAAFEYRRAVALRRTDRADEALDLLGQLTAESANAVVLYELADTQFERRDFALCTLTLQRLIEIPEYRHAAPKTNLLLVRALHYQGRLDEAIAHAEAAVMQDDEQHVVRDALATLYLDAERFEDAARLYSEAVQDGRLSPEVECVGGYLALAQEDLARASSLFSSTLQSRPNDARALLGAGMATAAEGKLAAAIQLLQRAAQAMPSHLGTLNALAWMQLLNGELDAADATLISAMSVDDSFAETYGGRAVVAAMRSDEGMAREFARTALKLDRESFSAAYALLLLKNRSSPDGKRLDSMLEVLGRHLAPGGGSLKDAVLRMARRPVERR